MGTAQRMLAQRTAAHMMAAQRGAVQKCPAHAMIAQSKVAQKVAAQLTGQSLLHSLRADRKLAAQKKTDRRIPEHLGPVLRVPAHGRVAQRVAG